MPAVSLAALPPRAHLGDFSNTGRRLPTELAERLNASLASGYRIERELGSGGMATVYLATDLRHSREVAIKVMKPDLAAAVGTERFLREIDIAARLAHPNILPLLDSGDAAGLPYYAMPYIAGESLRERLKRETQLSLDEAIRIARDVADALDYAHAQGVVHRDIKPENILLQGGRALVADFGIARAIVRSADEQTLTRTGTTPGTPAYMSPEQAGAEAEIDGRSDIYALGCVLYEMIAGSPPFTGPSAQAILARHQLDPVPPLRTVRATVPVALEQAVMKALAKVRADRFATAGKFAEALAAVDLSVPGTGEERSGSWARIIGWSVASSAVALAAWSFTAGPLSRRQTPGLALDTSRYVVVSVDAAGRLSVSAEEEQLLRDALARWDGITVADRFMVRDALTRVDDALPAPERARRVARELSAGRYIQLELSQVRDSTRLRAVLFDTQFEHPLKESRARLARDLPGADSTFEELVDELLLREGGVAPRTSRGSSRSLPARQAFAAGHGALARWDLTAADSAFAAALGFDGAYGQASLWLALTRWWSRTPRATWLSHAERAVGDSTRLADRDRRLALALTLLGRDETEAACQILGRLAGRDQHDFAAWYAWATCLRRDETVVRDRRSASGWRFRSSRHAALLAYQRAFVLLPSIHRSVQTDAQVRSVLLIRNNQIQSGTAAPPDTTTFLAYPALASDTLVFVPYPTSEVLTARPYTQPLSNEAAIRRQQQVFNEIAAAWVSAYPRSPEALEALAVSLEMLRSPAALDTLRRARRLAVTPGDRFRLAAAEVWLQLKFSLPDDTARVRSACALADSLLNGDPSSNMGTGLELLRGRAARALARLRSAGATRQGEALVALASIGGPADSLARLEATVSETIRGLPPILRADSTNLYLMRAAVLALPHQRLRWWRDPGMPSWPLAAAQADFVRGDTAAARARLVALRSDRRRLAPGAVTIDALYPEAWLLAQLGDEAGAADWLDGTLTALPFSAPGAFNVTARPATLVHAMALRAQLAHSLGRADEARRWARAVVMLWSDADDFLQPIVSRMQQLAR
jgi:serine/threonine protein kinase